MYCRCFKKLVIGGLGDIVGAVPSSTLLHSTVCAALRPSTLLAHLICLAPPQLPSPLETAGGMTIPSYLQSLMTPPSPLSEVDTEALSKSPFGADSILQAYCSPSDSLAGEVGFWQLVELSLDVFMQRASVADSATQRKLMRQWYELILDVGAMRKLTSSSTTMSSQTARVVSRQ